MSIREIRKNLGWSQRKFADYFGISVANVQHWEQNVSNPPDYVPNMIVRILELEQAIKTKEH